MFPRWIPRLPGLRQTFSSMEFRWRRVVLKEYGTPFGWIMVIAAITLFNLWSKGEWTARPAEVATVFLGILVTVLMWLIAWRLKRSRRLVAD